MIYDMMVIDLRSDFPGEHQIRLRIPKEIDILETERLRYIWKNIGDFRVTGATYKVFIRYDEKNKDQVTEWRNKHDAKKRYGY